MTSLDKYTTEELIHIATNTENHLAIKIANRFECEIRKSNKTKAGLEEVIKKLSQEQ